MENSKSTKRALLTSALALLMCVTMLVGATFAWFTDTASTGVNKIQAGNLDVEIQDSTGHKIDTLNWVNKEGEAIANQESILWEPGCTYRLTPFKIVNTGNLALKYKIVITGLDGDSPLLDVIKFTYKVGGVESLLNEEGHLTAKGTAGASTDMITVSAHMDEAAGNDYMGKTLEGVKFTVYATQDTVENDSFGNTYDANAIYYPVIDLASLKDAIKNGGNVAVDADVEVSSVDTLANRTIISKPTTLQLNKKITSPNNMGNNSFNFTALIVAADTTINASENGGIDTGVNGAYAINVISGANLVINGGTYYGGGTAVQVQKGTVTINGGHFAVEAYSNPAYGCEFMLNCIDKAYKDGTANIIVKGGTFVNFNPANCKAEGAGTNFVAEGYGVVATPQANGDVWYTVVEKSATGTTFGSGTHTLSTGITATSPNAVAVKAENGADITITGGAYDGGKGGNNVCVWAKAGSNVTIKDGTFTVGGDANDIGNSVVYCQGGNVTIEGGFFYTNHSYNGKYYVLNLQNGTSGTITVTGGTFVNYNPSTGDDHDQPTNFVADGYKVISETQTNGDVWYTVVPQ